ncbi:MAG: LysR substrate-binding domain-containing protein [Flavobacteriales bacterium]
MTLQQIKYVLAVAKYAHFETAAESCFVTQSTLSTMINRLEEEMGIFIFNRKTKPVTITKEGRKLIEQMRVVQHEFEALDNLTQELKGEMVGELRIAIIPTIAPYLLPLFLADFANQFPKVKMIVSEMTTANIQSSLKNRAIDVGILAIPLVDSQLDEVEVYEEPFLVYDCSSHKIPKSTSVSELDFSNLWFLEDGHCLSTQVKQICELSADSPTKGVNFQFKAGSLDSLMRFTKANNGITILPYLLSSELKESEKERLIPFANPVPVRKVGLITHKHFVKKKLLVEMEKTIKKSVSELLPQLKNSEAIRPL